MSSKWKKVKLTDITQNLNYKRVPLSSVERLKKQGMYPYYGASGIVDYINDYIFDGRYLLISEDGENLRSRKTPIAFQAIGKFWVNNHAHILKEKEEGILDYLEYYFSILDLTPYITGAVQPKLNKRNLEDIDFFIPHKKIRLKINKILNSFTNKITLNNQINETLEAMAQALFKSWFIDFEPVKAKIEAKEAGQDVEGIILAAMSAISGKDSKALKTLQTTAPEEYAELKAITEQFPDSLEESELGMIPKGWEVGKLGDITRVYGGYAFKSKDLKGTTYPVIKIKNIDDSGNVDICNVDYIDEIIAEKASKFQLQDGDLIMAMTGATVGKIGLVNTFNKKIYLNQRVALFRSDTFRNKISYYLYSLLFNKQIKDYIHNLAQGSAQPNISGSQLENISHLLAPKKIIDNYLDFITPFYTSRLANQAINKTLTELRDTLLPKLLSGEIDVSNVEIDELLENEA